MSGRLRLHVLASGSKGNCSVVEDVATEAPTSCRVLTIEANHDVDMLANGPYPAYLKARIAGERGHLTNEQSGEPLGKLLDDRLECVVACTCRRATTTTDCRARRLPACSSARGTAHECWSGSRSGS